MFLDTLTTPARVPLENAHGIVQSHRSNKIAAGQREHAFCLSVCLFQRHLEYPNENLHEDKRNTH